MMDNISVINNNGELVVNSREVAKNFNKRHTEVLRLIESKISENAKLRSQNFFIESSYKVQSNNKTYKEYLMTRDGFSFLVMGFTGKKADDWKIKYIEAFNKMEYSLNQNKKLYKVPTTPMEAFKLMFEISEQHEDKINKIDGEIKEFKDSLLLSPGEYAFITKSVKNRVNYVKIQYYSGKINKAQTNELYRAISRDINTVANVATRSQIRKKYFDKVMQVINNWNPSIALKMKLDELANEC